MRGPPRTGAGRGDCTNSAQRTTAGRTAAALQADQSIDSVLAVGPHVCEAASDAIDDVGADIHLSCFDMTPGVITLTKDGKVKYTIDQQQRLQGYRLARQPTRRPVGDRLLTPSPRGGSASPSLPT